MKESIRILIVDDEAMMRDLLSKILGREGFSTLSAESGERALEVMSAESIDLIITDIKMPKMDGFQLLKRLKEDYPDVGVIIMTAYGDTYTVRDALLLGADEYVTKPFKSHEVALVVERAYWRILSGKNEQEQTQMAQKS